MGREDPGVSDLVAGSIQLTHAAANQTWYAMVNALFGRIRRFKADGRAIAKGTAHGLVKVLTVSSKDRILGVTIVGERAADLLAGCVLGMKHGLGLNKIVDTMPAYPTLSEANMLPAGVWKRAHAPRRLLRWVERYHAWERT